MATPKPILRVDRREFDRTLSVYTKYCKKDVPDIVNTKSLFVARGALRETERSTKEKIREELLAPTESGVPLAALLVNKARRTAGLPGLYGEKMEKAIEKLIKSRRVATLAAGWIGAIKQLTPLAGRGGPPTDRSVKLVGQPKGYAQPAVEGLFKVKASIVNNGGAKWDTRDTATAKAMPGLQKAFDNEERSMREYIERKLKESARRAGIKT